MRKFIYAVSAVMAIILIILIAMLIYVTHLADAELKRADELLERVEQTSNPVHLVQLLELPEEREVIFTTFTDEVLGSGIKRHELDTNELGLLTYQNKVVIATATYECLNSSHGACKKIQELPEDYTAFNYFDEMTIEFRGKIFEAIVLDSCGSCSVDKGEEHQRVDILVEDNFDHTKELGKVILN